MGRGKALSITIYRSLVLSHTLPMIPKTPNDPSRKGSAHYQVTYNDGTQEWYSTKQLAKYKVDATHHTTTSSSGSSSSSNSNSNNNSSGGKDVASSTKRRHTPKTPAASLSLASVSFASSSLTKRRRIETPAGSSTQARTPKTKEHDQRKKTVEEDNEEGSDSDR